MSGLLGYSTFFLLTRASYALDDVRSPTTVFLGVTLAAIAGMAVSSALVDGNARVVVLGLAHGVATTVGSIGLYRRLRRRVGRPIPVLATTARVAVASVLGAGLAWMVVDVIGWDTRGEAVVSLVLAGIAGVAVYGGVLAALRSPEVATLRAWVGRHR
jgi:putative peptidoglycan lipid II flippase